MIFLGTITGTFKTGGNMIISVELTGNPFLVKDSSVFVGYSEAFLSEHKIISWETYKTGAVIKISGVGSKEEAAKFVEQGIFADENDIQYRSEKKLTENEISDFKVLDNNTKKVIGKVVEVLILEANDVWFVDTPDGILPLPVIEEVILNIDFDNKTIYVNIIPGLLDLIEKKE